MSMIREVVGNSVVTAQRLTRTGSLGKEIVACRAQVHPGRCWTSWQESWHVDFAQCCYWSHEVFLLCLLTGFEFESSHVPPKGWPGHRELPEL
eukprot:2826117-Amphidinium_carterae.2